MKKRSKKSSLVYVVIGLVIVAMLLPMIIRLLPNNMTTNKPPVDNTQTETPDDSGGTTDEDHIHVFNRFEPIPVAHKSLATCTTSAVYYLSCSCGLVARDPALVFYVGDPLGHDFVNGKCTRCTAFDEGGGNSGGTTVDPAVCSHAIIHTKYVNYEKEANKTYCTPFHHKAYVACFECGTLLEDTGLSFSCKWRDSLTDTCVDCGSKLSCPVTFTYSVEKGLHKRSAEMCPVCYLNFAEVYSTECFYVNGICPACGAEDPDYIDPNDPTHTHVYDQKIVDGKYLQSNATCTQPAFYYYSCTCGEFGTSTFPDGDPTGLGHITTTHAAQAATCESYGWYEYVTCSREGCDYTTYNTIPATGHTYVNGVCTTCQAANPKYEQVDAFVNHQPVLNADQTDFEWSGNWTLGDMDADGNYREFNLVHSDTNHSNLKWLIHVVDGIDPGSAGFWHLSAGYRVSSTYQVGVARAYDMVMTWTAPEGGTVKIGATDFAIIAQNNNYNLRIYLNDTLVYPSSDYLNIGYYAIDTDEEFIEALADLRLTVKAGDKLQFRCSRIGEQGMNTAFMPTVEYVHQHTYVTTVEHNFTGVTDYACHVETKTCSSCGDVVKSSEYGVEAEFVEELDDSGLGYIPTCRECGAIGEYVHDHTHTYNDSDCGCDVCGHIPSTSAHAKLEEGETCPDCGKVKE